MDMEVDAYIPATYIRNEVQKLDMYKRVACIASEEDFNDLSEELVDRYGDIPPVFDSLLQIALLKAMCHTVYISECKQSQSEIKLTLYPKARLKTELLQNFLEERKSYLKFVLEANPYFIYKLPRKQKPMTPKAEADWMFDLLKSFLAELLELVEEKKQ